MKEVSFYKQYSKKYKFHIELFKKGCKMKLAITYKSQ